MIKSDANHTVEEIIYLRRIHLMRKGAGYWDHRAIAGERELHNELLGKCNLSKSRRKENSMDHQREWKGEMQRTTLSTHISDPIID